MKLSDKLASSSTQISGYRVQPYQAVTDLTAYGNRFISPELVNPPVFDARIQTAAAGRVPRNVSAVTDTPSPLVLRNGAAAPSGNNYPARRG